MVLLSRALLGAVLVAVALLSGDGPRVALRSAAARPPARPRPGPTPGSTSRANRGRLSPQDGFQVHVEAPGWGRDHNQVSGAGRGLSNIPCR